MKLGVSGGDAVERAEFLHLFQRHIVAAQVQPAVEKHRAVAAGEDRAVAVDPARTLRIMRQSVPEEHGADLGAAEREAEVAGRAGADRIDGEAAGLVGCFGKEEALGASW